MRKKRLIRKIARFCIILLLMFVMLYSGLQILETTVLRTAQEEIPGVSAKTVVRDGVSYFPKQDMTVFLILGIDRYGEVEASGSYNNHGAADVAMLLILDEANETCSILQLNRDTMLTMPVIGIGGKQAGTYFGQLALAHTYGSGLKDSCENVRTAISDFLYGIRIDYYVSMSMDAIALLNDAVGGVTVNVTEDFSGVDPTIGKGEVTLHGEQAINYVRTRKDVGDQLNISRIQRQQDYISGFVKAFRNKLRGNKSFVSSAYEDVEDYLVSDCPVNSIIRMIERYSKYEVTEVLTPEGENVMGDTYYEFYADEDKLDEMILRIFYAPKT